MVAKTTPDQGVSEVRKRGPRRTKNRFTGGVNKNLSPIRAIVVLDVVRYAPHEAFGKPMHRPNLFSVQSGSRGGSARKRPTW